MPPEVVRLGEGRPKPGPHFIGEGDGRVAVDAGGVPEGADDERPLVAIAGAQPVAPLVQRLPVVLRGLESPEHHVGAALPGDRSADPLRPRSEERRVGTECTAWVSEEAVETSR